MTALDIRALEYRENTSHYFDRIRHLSLASFLDSGVAGNTDPRGHFDIITAAPTDSIWVTPDGQVMHENRLTQTHTNMTRVVNGSPFQALAQLFAKISPIADSGFPFTGGLLGFWAYELGALTMPERLPPRTNSHTPLMYVGLFLWALITDHRLQRTHVIFHPAIDHVTKDTVLTALARQPSDHRSAFQLTAPFQPMLSRGHYQQAFNRIQDHLLAGDCYQVNLTQAFTAPYQGDSWQAYQQLRRVSPAPYAAFLSYPGITVLSHSPERFLRVIDRRVSTCPIKGTIARGATPEQDRAQAEQLQASLKDRAENVMIVDLLRNDLGKHCATGSIRVPQLFALASYANVHHLVSTVTGLLPENGDVFALLADAFPGGSITGAPKIRAMEIIRTVEPTARSVYCGTIGYISCNGKMDTNIAIRTLVAHDHTLHCWGGGAIVADSDGNQEYHESVIKVSNLMATLEKTLKINDIKEVVDVN